jgi:dihydrofolate synthase / folylpolyglutamate synthase
MLTHPILSQLSQHGIKLGLERMRDFMQTLGEPQSAYPAVHVAGTNGKGSVCAMVTAVLVDAAYTVGTNYSPHAEALNERVQINGIPIDDGSLNELVEAVNRARLDWAESRRISTNALTYFEFMTAVAFLAFASRQVNAAVVEVGLGGRLDATNILKPQVCAITHVGFDHQELLGDTLTAIAGEKAGILMPGVPVVMGPMPEEARKAILQRARALNAPVWRPGNELRRELRRDGWVLATPDGSISGIRLGLQGAHQGANATVALGVLHQLRRQGFLIPDEAIKSGLQRAFMPGRIEELRPGLILDGAHNAASVEVLAKWLVSRPRPESRILLWGMGEGRDPVKCIEALVPLVDEVVTTRCAHPKAFQPVDLALQLQELDVTLSAGGDIEETLPEVYQEAHETIVAGSLFLAGAARSIVNSGALDGVTPGQGVPDDLLELEAQDDGEALG